MTVRCLGELNGICLLLDGGLIRGIEDRGRTGPTVPLAEETLVDLNEPARSPTDLWALSDWPSGERSWGALGFGRSLHYRPAVATPPYSAAAEVDIELPAEVRYTLRLPGKRTGPSEVQLSPAIRMSVRIDGPWAWAGDAVVVHTGKERTRVTLRIETRAAPGVVADTTVVTTAGDLRAAYLVRAALGPGFVRCHVLSADGTDQSPSASGRVVAVGEILGPDVVKVDAEITSSAEVAAVLDIPRPERMLVVRDDEALWGPALHLSVTLQAGLTISADAADALALYNSDRLERRWTRAELIGVVHRSPGGGAGGELVVCESVADGLLGCQAVGYADWRGCNIAFLDPVARPPDLLGLPSQQRVDALTEAATAAVPEALRRPDAETITVFTTRLPLHLTRYDGAARWVNRYRIAHLPGETASILVPRHVMPSTPGRTPMSVVFDALSALTETESTVFADELGRGLATPLLLSGRTANEAVLAGVLNRLDAELVLLIAHGQDNWIEDADGFEIAAPTIAGWRFPGRPIIFNNSCSSWTSTGPAFLAAGARSYIGTLWPINSASASAMAGSLAARLIEGPAIAKVVHDAVREVARDNPATALAYFLVGVPDEAFHSAPPLDDDERINALLSDMKQLVEVLDAFAVSGRGDLTWELLRPVVDGLRHRFATLRAPGELGRPLPQPFPGLTTQDGEYLLLRVELTVLGRLAGALPEQATSSVLDRMVELLPRAQRELAERVEKGWAGAIQEPARFAADVVLPCAYELAEPRRGREAEALHWVAEAAKLLGVSVHPPDARTERVHPEHFNRIGAVYYRMGRVDQARALFATALGMAAPDWPDRANALSNLANSLVRTGEPEAAVTALLNALTEQAARSDYANGAITAVRAVQAATTHRIELSGSDLAAMADCVERITEPRTQRLRQCLLHANTAVYHAVRTEGELALADHRLIVPQVGDDKAVLRTLNDLPLWYRTNGDPGIAARLLRANAGPLARTGHPLEAAVSLIDAANAFLESYRYSRAKEDLAGALDAAHELAELVRSEPPAAAQGPEWQEDIRQNTLLIFRQLATSDDITLAARAYRSVQAWRRQPADEVWELVGDALHPRNGEAVYQLAEAGYLRRQARLHVDRSLSLTAEVVTVRSDPVEAGFPSVVVGLQPLRERCADTSVAGPGRTGLAAGHAVYELPRDTQVSIVRRAVGGLGRATDGTIGGRFTWGSRRIPYDFVVSFDRGLLPITLHADRVRGHLPEVTAVVGPDGVRFEIVADDDQRWLADLLFLFADDQPGIAYRLTRFAATLSMELDAYHRVLGFSG